MMIQPTIKLFLHKILVFKKPMLQLLRKAVGFSPPIEDLTFTFYSSEVCLSSQLECGTVELPKKILQILKELRNLLALPDPPKCNQVSNRLKMMPNCRRGAKTPVAW